MCLTADLNVLPDDMQGRGKHTERVVQLQRCRCAAFNPKALIFIQCCPFYIGVSNSETPGVSENMMLHQGNVLDVQYLHVM